LASLSTLKVEVTYFSKIPLTFCGIHGVIPKAIELFSTVPLYCGLDLYNMKKPFLHHPKHYFLASGGLLGGTYNK
jgi:hypothetical protein